MKQALIVLGMHRSGTSSVAGTLAMLGAEAPKTLMPAHLDNQKGYWESAPLVELNDRILASAGSNWSDWRAFSRDWEGSAAAAGLKRELSDRIAQEFGESPLIVLKDPRLCRLFPVWKDVLQEQGFTLHILIPLRSPLEIAASLAKRDGYSNSRSLLIWLRNMLEAEHVTRGLPRCLIHWTDFMRDWRGQIDRASRDLGVIFPGRSDLTDSRVDQFVDLNLRRNVSPDRLPANAYDWLTKVDHALHRLVIDPEDTEALKILNDVRGSFDASAHIYGEALAGLENELSHQAGVLAHHRENWSAHTEALQRSHDELQAELGHRSAVSEGRIAELTQGLEHANLALQDLAQARAAEQTAANETITNLQGAVAHLENELENLRSAYRFHETDAENRHADDQRRILELQSTIAQMQTAQEGLLAELDQRHSEQLLLLQDRLSRSEHRRQTLIKAIKGSPIKSAFRIAAGRMPR